MACFQDKPKGGSTKCNDKKCGTCDYIEETQKLKITSTGRDFVIKSPMNCKSKNFLYIITCKGCNEQYVGMTNDTLNSRVCVHKQHINNPHYRILGASKHIDECSDLQIKFTIAPFFKLNDTKSLGLAMEQKFIKQFLPSLNRM